MKYQYMLVTALLTLTALSARAQVKIGSNPTSLTTTANPQVEATNGSQVVVNKTTGNVGVGNTATNPMLSVPRGAIEFQSGENTATTPIFNFFSNFGGEATSRLTVLQNGNVGIGATTPVEKLHINGNVLSLGNFYSFSTQYGIGTKPSITNVFGLNIGGIEFETAAGTSMKITRVRCLLLTSMG
ncbi:hypothetical protein [Spirosoma pulveris]